VKPRLLDLFSGAGGAGMGYHRAGFDVVGVDLAPQPRYPFEFRRMDALTALAHVIYRHDGWEFDAIHASPPCQAYLNLSAVNRKLGRELGHRDMVAPTRGLIHQAGLPYVIENVEGAPLHNPIRLCGSSFGLAVRRHRLFETNFPVMAHPCAHHLQTEPRYWTGWRPGGEHRLARVVQVYGNAGGRDEWPAAMGIDWMTLEELSEAIPPAYTEHIGGYLLAAVQKAAA
jgi:DNA (cytosine-5)-methyltransferase 1